MSDRFWSSELKIVSWVATVPPEATDVELRSTWSSSPEAKAVELDPVTCSVDEDVELELELEVVGAIELTVEVEEVTPPVDLLGEVSVTKASVPIAMRTTTAITPAIIAFDVPLFNPLRRMRFDTAKES